MASSKIPFRLKSDEELGYKVSDKDVNAILKKRFGIKGEKKPVKFTWKGLANFAHLFDTNIFSTHRARRIKDLMEGNDKSEEKDKDQEKENDNQEEEESKNQKPNDQKDNEEKGGGLSKQQMENLLEAINNIENDVNKKVNANKKKVKTSKKSEKDW